MDHPINMSRSGRYVKQMAHKPPRKNPILSPKKNTIPEKKLKEGFSAIPTPEKPVKEKCDTKTENVSDFLYQCRPSGLYSVIQSLNDVQKKAIEDIGFGGLLHLSLSRNLNFGLLGWLVSRFNPTSRMLSLDSFRSFPITADDVFDVLKIPRNEGCGVSKYSRGELIGEDRPTLLVRFENMYGILAGKKVSILSDLMKERLTGGGEDFKRVFVLFCLCSFLTPPHNRVITIQILKFLEGVSMIKNLDWCSYVLQSLCDSVFKFKSNSVNKYCGGFIILLQFWYLHRLKWRGISEPSTIPLIRHWDDKKISNRCLQELKGLGYGYGELVLNTYPISRNGKVFNKDNVGDDTTDRSPRKITFCLLAYEMDDDEIRKVETDSMERDQESYYLTRE